MLSNQHGYGRQLQLLLVAACSLSVAPFETRVSPGPPEPTPQHPYPNWSWDTVPLAFHGANQSGEFNEDAVESIASNYLMATIEKWYTKCGSKHPIQNGPWCDVEKAMYSAFARIKAINPNTTVR